MDHRVHISYLGLVGNVIGRREEDIEILRGTTVRDLLSLLSCRHGDSFQKSVFRNSGELRAMTQVCVNDRDIDELEGLETPLAGGQQISVVVGVYPPEGG